MKLLDTQGNLMSSENDAILTVRIIKISDYLNDKGVNFDRNLTLSMESELFNNGSAVLINNKATAKAGIFHLNDLTV